VFTHVLLNRLSLDGRRDLVPSIPEERSTARTEEPPAATGTVGHSHFNSFGEEREKGYHIVLINSSIVKWINICTVVHCSTIMHLTIVFRYESSFKSHYPNIIV
jgi:hypothetical protein